MANTNQKKAGIAIPTSNKQLEEALLEIKRDFE